MILHCRRLVTVVVSVVDGVRCMNMVACVQYFAHRRYLDTALPRCLTAVSAAVSCSAFVNLICNAWYMWKYIYIYISFYVRTLLNKQPMYLGVLPGIVSVIFPLLADNNKFER